MNLRNKGIHLTLTADLCYACMAVFLGYLHGMSPYTSTFFRFGIGLVVIGAGVASGCWKLRLIRKPLLFWRGLLGGAAITIYFITLNKLGLGRATLISHLYPAFAAILAVFLLREKLTKEKVLAFLLAISGIYILSKTRGTGGETASLWDALAVIGAVLSACAIIIIRKLHETDSTIAIFFAQCLIGVCIVLFPGVHGLGWTEPNTLILLLLVGGSATVGQLLMTAGLKFLSAGTGSLLHMGVPLLSMIAGVLFFREPFGWSQVVAFLLITASCVVLVVQKKQSG